VNPHVCVPFICTDNDCSIRSDSIINTCYCYFGFIDPDKIRKGEIFLILNSQLNLELIELVRIAKTKGCRIGEDICIISYNESPINEIILDGLTVMSTNFIQMGELAAKMILEKPFKKIHCDFTLIRRSTF